VGNVLTTTWADNTVSAATYDTIDRVLTSTDPKNETASFVYDDIARTVTQIDPRGMGTVFQYDLRGKRTRKNYHNGSHEDWTYDEVGQVQTYTTAGGQVATITRDGRNRPTLIDWSDATPDVSATYDGASRLLTLNNANSALTYTYDAAGQVLSETQDLQSPVDLPAKTISYSYDVDGNRSGLTYPSGTALSYTYTERSQLKEVSADGPPPLATYTYDLADRRTGKTLENGTNTTYTYDAADRLLSIAHSNNSGSVQSFTYGLTAVGSRTYRTEAGASIPSNRDSYGYDVADQLIQVKYNHDLVTDSSSRQVDYAYDAAGNRQTMTNDPDGSGSSAAVVTSYTTNDLNQYTGVGAGLSLPSYDVNGNTTHLATTLGESAWNYSFNAQNELIAGSNGAGTVNFSFAYDARRRCVARTVNGETTANVYDGWNLIEELSVSDTLSAKHLHGAETDEILCTIGTSATVYHHHDGLGSVTALTDAMGALVERYTYDVYGTPSTFDASGAPLSASAYGNRFLYTGREWLADLKLSDHRHRYYQPEIGRWLSRDPIEERGGINLYQYVGNKVTIFNDIFGLEVTGNYSISTGLLTITDNDDPKKTVTVQASSGDGKVEHCNLVNGGGPIPPGSYSIYPRPGGYPNPGNPAYVLDPNDGNPGNDQWDDGPAKLRYGFREHIGDPAKTYPNNGTEGCITPSVEDMKKLNEILRKTKRGPRRTITSRPDPGKNNGHTWRNQPRLGTITVVK
jgi:RHS repeat-associated protein